MIRRTKPKSQLLRPTPPRTNHKRRSFISSKRPTQILLLIVFTATLLFFIGTTQRDDKQSHSDNNKQVETTYSSSSTAGKQFEFEVEKTDPLMLVTEKHVTTKKQRTTNDEKDAQSCEFRHYVPRRHYNISQPQPFLQDAKYIFGFKPFILKGSEPHKICIDTSPWETRKSGQRPFSDGQNLSIMSLREFPSEYYKQKGEARLRRDEISTLVELYGDQIDEMYISVIYVGDSQCRWRESEEEMREYGISDRKQPPSTRTLVLLLDKNFNTIAQKDLLVEFDGSKWGSWYSPPPQRVFKPVDDPRLFFHQGEVWILYRNGRVFEFDEQTHNKLYFERKGKDDFEVYIKIGDTRRLKRGRNMAMISESVGNNEHILKTLFWVDPITVVTVETNLTEFKKGLRGKQVSHMHGTNGFMIPLSSTGELLGIGHFHRPHDREESDFARHGHHYTHAFFTIQKNNDKEYRLKRLSKEFVFPSMSKGDDTDMIQFASGLELLGDQMDGRLLISYGINDCEGASMFLDMSVVQGMLQDVKVGTEVVDYMMKEGASIEFN